MQFKGYTLNAFQVEAARAIEAGNNILLSAPTGAGKTLVAEYAIHSAMQDGRRAIYTSPIKALSNQKYRDFREEGLEVGLMTGDLTLNAEAPILIMTTEIFRNTVFEDPERLDDVEFAIFDEIHFLDDVSRGTVWEESLIFAPDHIRFVGLSATIENLDQFGRWIQDVRKQDLAVIEHKERPVPLDHKMYHPASGIFRLQHRKRATANAQKAAGPGDARGGVERGRKGRGSRHAGRKGKRPPPRGPRPYVQLLDDLQKDRLLPILFFCFSRKECEIKGDRNLHRRLLGRADQKKLHAIFDDICDRFELDPDEDPALRGILRRGLAGVGYHHAGMLPIHKEVVERMFTSGLLKLLFTTETFALGINMPARTVIFDSLKKYDGVSMDYMRARDYLQMAGRAGRQGIDDEGLVVSILEDEDLREAPLNAYVSGKVEPVMSRFNLGYSTILNLFERLGDNLLDAYDRSFAAFQAAKGSQKTREVKRRAARRELTERIEVLHEAGYLDDREILPRGKLAQQINGYEIQVTELMFQGVLEDVSIFDLPVLFSALVHEERRRFDTGKPKRLPPVAKAADLAIRRFVAIELTHGQKETLKLPDFGIAPAIAAWARGCDIEELERLARTDAGDVVRTLRMAIQMMRQLRHALGNTYDLGPRLEEAIVCVNRDVVDAKRQFELG